jgi:hypothetical protein
LLGAIRFEEGYYVVAALSHHRPVKTLGLCSGIASIEDVVHRADVFFGGRTWFDVFHAGICLVFFINMYFFVLSP